MIEALYFKQVGRAVILHRFNMPQFSATTVKHCHSDQIAIVIFVIGQLRQACAGDKQLDAAQRVCLFFRGDPRQPHRQPVLD